MLTTTPASAAAAVPTPPLQQFVATHPRWCVLTGAGVSIASGIPGYRSDDGTWQRKPPVTHQQFTGSGAVRQRYWARSLLGWPVIDSAMPNAAHHALAALEHAGHVTHVITQNVDGLHQRAGSRVVTDLHGRLDRVVCVDCRTLTSRAALQQALRAANPAWCDATATVAPDGDMDVAQDTHAFVVPACTRCGGMLMPDVVFYGANVPKDRVAAAFAAVDAADALLVVGSSLTVYSGYRFCERAHGADKPVLAINRGHTRADALLATKVEADCAPTLQGLCAALGIACDEHGLAGGAFGSEYST